MVFYHLSDWKTKQDLWYWHRTLLVFLAILNDRRYQMLWINYECSKCIIKIFKALVDLIKEIDNSMVCGITFSEIQTALGVIIFLCINICLTGYTLYARAP